MTYCQAQIFCFKAQRAYSLFTVTNLTVHVRLDTTNKVAESQAKPELIYFVASGIFYVFTCHVTCSLGWGRAAKGNQMTVLK